MINLNDYTDLAHHYAHKSNKRYLQGVELEDLYQCAMIGLWTASVTYDPSRGQFTTYAHRFIEGEINSLVYKAVSIDGKRTRIPRIREELFSDLSEVDASSCEQLLYTDDQFAADFMDEYLDKLSLPTKELTFFHDMLKHGETDATKMYMQRHDVSRQYASVVKADVRYRAKKYYKEVT